jgi:glycosyltransferase involved in cell wall biosynthesis
MASGVPLVTTRVGQAMDLVRHGENAWMVDVQDAEGLAHWAEYVLFHQQSREILEALKNGRKTAETNSYDSQIPHWGAYMQGFVENCVGSR